MKRNIRCSSLIYPLLCLNILSFKDVTASNSNFLTVTARSLSENSELSTANSLPTKCDSPSSIKVIKIQDQIGNEKKNNVSGSSLNNTQSGYRVLINQGKAIYYLTNSKDQIVWKSKEVGLDNLVYILHGRESIQSLAETCFSDTLVEDLFVGTKGYLWELENNIPHFYGWINLEILKDYVAKKFEQDPSWICQKISTSVPEQSAISSTFDALLLNGTLALSEKDNFILPLIEEKARENMEVVPIDSQEMVFSCPANPPRNTEGKKSEGIFCLNGDEYYQRCPTINTDVRKAIAEGVAAYNLFVWRLRQYVLARFVKKEDSLLPEGSGPFSLQYLLDDLFLIEEERSYDKELISFAQSKKDVWTNECFVYDDIHEGIDAHFCQFSMTENKLTEVTNFCLHKAGTELYAQFPEESRNYLELIKLLYERTLTALVGIVEEENINSKDGNKTSANSTRLQEDIRTSLTLRNYEDKQARTILLRRKYKIPDMNALDIPISDDAKLYGGASIIKNLSWQSLPYPEYTQPDDWAKYYFTFYEDEIVGSESRMYLVPVVLRDAMWLFQRCTTLTSKKFQTIYKDSGIGGENLYYDNQHPGMYYSSNSNVEKFLRSLDEDYKGRLDILNMSTTTIPTVARVLHGIASSFPLQEENLGLSGYSLFIQKTRYRTQPSIMQPTGFLPYQWPTSRLTSDGLTLSEQIPTTTDDDLRFKDRFLSTITESMYMLLLPLEKRFFTGNRPHIYLLRKKMPSIVIDYIWRQRAQNCIAEKERIEKLLKTETGLTKKEKENYQAFLKELIQESKRLSYVKDTGLPEVIANLLDNDTDLADVMAKYTEASKIQTNVMTKAVEEVERLLGKQFTQLVHKILTNSFDSFGIYTNPAINQYICHFLIHINNEITQDVYARVQKKVGKLKQGDELQEDESLFRQTLADMRYERDSRFDVLAMLCGNILQSCFHCPYGQNDGINQIFCTVLEQEPTIFNIDDTNNRPNPHTLQANDRYVQSNINNLIKEENNKNNFLISEPSWEKQLQILMDLSINSVFRDIFHFYRADAEPASSSSVEWNGSSLSTPITFKWKFETIAEEVQYVSAAKYLLNGKYNFQNNNWLHSTWFDIKGLFYYLILSRDKWDILPSDLQYKLYCYVLSDKRNSIAKLEDSLLAYPIASQRLQKIKNGIVPPSNKTSNQSHGRMDATIVYEIAQATITASSVIDTITQQFGTLGRLVIEKYMNDKFRGDDFIRKNRVERDMLALILRESGYFVEQPKKHQESSFIAQMQQIQEIQQNVNNNNITILWTNNKIDDFLNQWSTLAKKYFLYSPQQSTYIFPDSINNERRRRYGFFNQLEKYKNDISMKRTMEICPQTCVVVYDFAQPHNNIETSMYSLLSMTRQIHQIFFERYMTPLIGEMAFHTGTDQVKSIIENKDASFTPLGESAIKHELKLMDSILKYQGPFATFLRKELTDAKLANINIIGNTYWNQLAAEIVLHLGISEPSTTAFYYNSYKILPFSFNGYAVPTLAYALNTQTENTVLQKASPFLAKSIQFACYDPEYSYAYVAREFVTTHTEYDGSCLYRALDTHCKPSCDPSSSQQEDNKQTSAWTQRSQSARLDMQSMIWQLATLRAAILTTIKTVPADRVNRIIEMIYPEALATSHDPEYIERINKVEKSGFVQPSWQILQRLIKERVDTLAPMVGRITKSIKDAKNWSIIHVVDKTGDKTVDKMVDASTVSLDVKRDIVLSYLDMLINFAVNVKQHEDYFYLCRDVSHVFLENTKVGIPVALAFLKGFNLTILEEIGNTYEIKGRYTNSEREKNTKTVYILFSPSALTGTSDYGPFQRLELIKEEISDAVVAVDEGE